MNEKVIDPNGGGASETADNLIAALKNARDQGKPFVIEWRQIQRQQGEGDAGCGCGTGVEFFPGR